MTSVDYQEIFENFLGNITDPELFNLNTSDAYSLLTEFLHKAVADQLVRHLFISINLDDEVQVLSFEMKYVVDEESDRNFVITALAKYMVYEWLQKQVKSTLLTMQFFGTKEQKMYAQSNHINSVQALRDSAFKEARDFIRDRGYIQNEYLNGGVT